MPGLTFVKILGDLKFASYGFTLPVDWKTPAGAEKQAEHYGRTVTAEHRRSSQTLVPAWFRAAEEQQFFHKICDEVGDGFKKFFERFVDAVQFAHTMWKLQARFQNLRVMAVSALGEPGCLTGPDLEPLIKSAPTMAEYEGSRGLYRDAAAKGVGRCFKDWQDGVTVPGLPWYPAFGAFAGPMAPPLPNVPVPLVACPSSKVARITDAGELKREMCEAFGAARQHDPKRFYEGLFDAIGTVLSLSFLTWLSSQQVTLVMGRGPVPGFSPPATPAGPVVGGDILSVPGHLMS